MFELEFEFEFELDLELDFEKFKALINSRSRVLVFS